MKKKKIEPVDAVSAPAKEVLPTSEKERIKGPQKDDACNYVSDEGDRLFTRDEVTRILNVRLRRYVEGVLGNLKCKNFDEVKDLVEYARSVLHVTDNLITSKESVFKNAVDKFEEQPKPTLNINLFNGIEYGLNIYAAYYNVNVRAVIDDDGYLKKIPSIKSGAKCCYLFMGDEIPEDVNSVVVSFSDFVKMVEKSGCLYISHLYDGEYIWHIDAVPSFTKDVLSKSFEKMSLKEKNEYLFLFKIRRLVGKGN